LAPYVVVLPEPTSVNPNTAGPEVLQATIEGLSPGQAAALVSSRERAWFRDAADLTNRLKAIAPALAEQQDILLETRSRYFIVHSRLHNGRATRLLDGLIRREGIGERYRTSVLWVREPAMPGIEG
jgi:general secretion pathway protein K